MIKNNAYRILGVLANTSIKEIQKNLSKLKAHLSIGKELKLSFDNEFFGALTRDETVLKKAKNLLQLDNNKLEQALFWLVNANEIDGVAIEHIKKGNIAKALGIWEKQVQKSAVNAKNFSFYNNLSTLLFAKKEYSTAIKLKSELIESKFIKNFSTLVCGDKYKVEKSNLLDTFIANTMSALKETGMKDPQIIERFSESSQNINEIVSHLFVKDPISNIESAIKQTKKLIENVENNTEKIQVSASSLKKVLGRKLASNILRICDIVDADTGELIEKEEVVIKAETKLEEHHIEEIIASGTEEIVLYKKDITDKTAGDIGRELMKNTKQDITKLKKILGSEHFSYSLYADKLASQLEQCGVAYYNQTANDLDYIDVYKYALLLAEGDRIKNKLKEALKHSNNERKAEGIDFIVEVFKTYDEKLKNWKDGFGFIDNSKRKKKAKVKIRHSSRSLSSIDLNAPRISASLGINTKGMLKHALKLSETCRKVIKKIKSNRGKDDETYLYISSGLVNRLLSMIIAVENEDQKTIDYYVQHANHFYYQIRGDYRDNAINAINTNRVNLSKSCKLLKVIDLMDMNDESQEFFNNNAKVIRDNYASAQESYREQRKPPPPTRSIPEPSDEGCYIATMAYGDYDHPQVLALRKFRDRILKHSFLGRIFIFLYYRVSPFMAKKLKDKAEINIKIRKLVDKFIKIYRLD